MFSSRKDFALLARQVALSSREAAAKENTTTDLAAPFLVDVYQVRLWKLLHTPDKADVKTLAEAFHVGQRKEDYSMGLACSLVQSARTAAYDRRPL